MSLQELVSRVEADICDLLDVTKQTIEELKNSPSCDVDKLSALSARYVDLVMSIHSGLNEASEQLALSASENVGSGNYFLKKRLELAAALLSP